MEVEKKQNTKWVPDKFIGKGSYGSVCVAIRESDGGCFAVKSASKDSSLSVEALENEIMILRSLSSSSSSPFIVEYYGDDETASHRNLHMEYLPEGDVAKSGEVGDVELIRSYTWCLVKALMEVHSRGIVHCDVKGSNVLVGPTKGVVKLSDFGSSRLLNDGDDDQGLKMVPRGSPLWMAPEVVRGESQGRESDVWSLGCTVIQMFTGVPAWKDCGAHTLFQIGYSNDLPEFPAQLPELARDFLEKCLNRNPGQRWSCDQLLQHPFLLPVTPSMITAHSSPRSIFDWPNLDFSPSSSSSSSPSPSSSSSLYDEISAKDRIGELATTTGVNWESDGWVEVRALKTQKEEETISVYSVLQTRVEVEIHDDDYPTWINLSVSNDSDNHNHSHDDNNDEVSSSISGGDGASRCGHGDSYGGVKIIEKIESDINVNVELLFISALLYLLYSLTRNNNDILCKYECYIVLQSLGAYFLSLFASSYNSDSNIVYFECSDQAMSLLITSPKQKLHFNSQYKVKFYHLGSLPKLGYLYKRVPFFTSSK